VKQDKELEQYRALMAVPSKFEEGFSFSSLVGAVFVALVMVPGSLYMELVAGMGVGPAAQWVTVILFIEVAKRANAKLSRAQLFILFYMSGSIVSQTIHGTPLFTQFLVRSEAAVAFGISSLFPNWVAPANVAELPRTFFQTAWLPALGLIAFRMFFTKLDNAVLGYGLFRITSDVEKLPFPMAPLNAQGVMVLAEDFENSHEAQAAWRWRVFSIGGAIGMVFGLIYLGLPTLSGAILGQTLEVFPIPFVDWSTYTEEFLPAVATGLSFDLGQLIIGMVLPYYAMFGSFIGLVLTYIANPILQSDWLGVLYSWERGDTTVEILFKNNVNFYFSFGIGMSLAVALIGITGMVRTMREARASKRLEQDPDDDSRKRRKDRGDIPSPFIVLSYLTSTSCYILLSGYLIDWHPPVMLILFFFGFLYTPMISYVTARLEGIAGQVIEIPFIREICFILSGYQGVAIWFIPVPKGNYGVQTVFYKQAELLGTRFRSMWKSDLLLFPIILLSTLGFGSFIYGMAEIPGPVFPYTQEIWEFEAKNACLVYSSTLGEYSPFTEALRGWRVLMGFGFGVVVFGALSFFNAPITLFYGLVRGVSGTLPHVIIPQFIGALLGKYYFEKKLGLKWKQYIIVLSAGFFVGAGLLAIFCIGIVFLTKATSSLPY